MQSGSGVDPDEGSFIAPVPVQDRHHRVIDDDMKLVAYEGRLDVMSGPVLNGEPVLSLQVKDGIDGAVVQADHEVVVPCPAVQQVGARLAVEDVGAVAAMENVVARAAEHLVVAAVAAQLVGAGAASQEVVAAVAPQVVVAAAAVELVVAVIAPDDVGA